MMMKKISLPLSLVCALSMAQVVVMSEEACTPAQVAAADADAQAAAAILSSLTPLACGIVDAVDSKNAAAICEVVTDLSTGATALVPVFGTLAALTQVVAAKPADAAVTQAIAAAKANWKPRVKK